jgi:hypothetical protein
LRLHTYKRNESDAASRGKLLPPLHQANQPPFTRTYVTVRPARLSRMA